MWWPIHGPARALTTAPNGYRYQVFISYTTRESEVQLVKPFVDDLVHRLEERGIPIYYDGWYLARRQYEPYELAHLLEDAIESSAFTLAFVSPGYIDSDWCAFEWETTYLVHQPRPRPAQEYSLLPVVWKPLPRLRLSGRKRGMLQRVRERLRRPARSVDIAGKGTDGPFAPGAMAEVLGATLEYVTAWNPGHHLSP